MRSLLSVHAESESFPCIFLLSVSLFIFLGTAGNTLQTHILVFGCNVILFLFYLDFTNQCLALSSYIQQ